ncbi:MAG: type II toxin-antitoxin system death-on-curing family toxin [Cyanobacteria bacterium QS_4_48_99]|nr:MAG: type II toxin-antitoxin system death-on-curing family toxin [Cyanobacteria bacterium QS_4_48_99]PSO85622.1 MAG: type II toxin-antitoxin system death-on-curing family toxin [Cyanobacteria bacterium QS_3_48_167]
MSEPIWLDEKDILAYHSELLATSGGTAGILNSGSLESTLGKPKNLYYYSGGNATMYDLAACYGYGFVKNHVFADGNKRIGFTATYVFLKVNGIKLNASEENAAAFFLEMAASTQKQETEIDKLAIWLKENSFLI